MVLCAGHEQAIGPVHKRKKRGFGSSHAFLDQHLLAGGVKSPAKHFSCRLLCFFCRVGNNDALASSKPVGLDDTEPAHGVDMLFGVTHITDNSESGLWDIVPPADLAGKEPSIPPAGLRSGMDQRRQCCCPPACRQDQGPAALQVQ